MRNLDRWLGDGGMPLLGHLGVDITSYGDGWAEAGWVPTADAGNPGGTVQAGVQAVVLDAVMSFAGNAALESGERLVTLEMKLSTMKAAPVGTAIAVRGEILRRGRRIFYLQGWLRDPASGDALTHATGTFSLVTKG